MYSDRLRDNEHRRSNHRPRGRQRTAPSRGIAPAQGITRASGIAPAPVSGDQSSGIAPAPRKSSDEEMDVSSPPEEMQQPVASSQAPAREQEQTATTIDTKHNAFTKYREKRPSPTPSVASTKSMSTYSSATASQRPRTTENEPDFKRSKKYNTTISSRSYQGRGGNARQSFVTRLPARQFYVPSQPTPHPLSWQALPPAEPPKLTKLSGVFDKDKTNHVTSSVNLESNNLFRHKTLMDFAAGRVMRDGEVIKEPATTTDSAPSTPFALYVVTHIANKKASLTALSIDVFAPDRGDLRRVYATAYSQNELQHGLLDLNANYLLVGDILFVTGLEPTPQATNRGLADVIRTGINDCTKPFFKELWQVKTFTLLKREYQKDRYGLFVLATMKAGETTHFMLAVEGSRKLLKVPLLKIKEDFKLNLSKIHQDTMVKGDIFTPSIVSPFFSFQPQEDSDATLATLRLSISRIPTPPASFMTLRLANEEEKNLLLQRNEHLGRMDRTLAIMMIARSFRLTVPGISALAAVEADHREYTSQLVVVNRRDTALSVEFCITSETSRPTASLWKSGATVVFRAPFGIASGTIKTAVDTPGGVKISATAVSTHMRVVERMANHDFVQLFQSNRVVPDMVEQLFTYTDEEFEEKFEALLRETDSVATRLVDNMFGRPTPAPKLRHNALTNIPKNITYDGKKLQLHDEQMDIFRAIIGGREAITIAASFGSGKTLLATAVNNHLAKMTTENWHLIIAQSNNAVTNAISSAEKLPEEEEPQNILRLISEFNFRQQEVRTKRDFPAVLRKTLANPPGPIDFLEEETAKKYLNYIEEQMARIRNNPDDEQLVISELDDLAELANTTEPVLTKAQKIRLVNMFIRLYKPKRIFCTTSTLLNAFREDSPWCEHKRRVATIMVDEASQLTEAAFFTITLSFPDAKIVLIGDDHQLPAFAPTEASPTMIELANGRLLKRITDQFRLPVFPLNGVFRCHPQITEVLSKVFYESKLTPLAALKDRRKFTDEFKLPGTSPWIFADPEGCEQQTGTSYANEEEMLECERVVSLLLRRYQPSDIAVLSMYKAQTDKLSQLLGNTGVFVGTVDSSQGREFAISVVSTVRTSDNIDSEFMDQRERVNVALSRARDGCIILGRARSLQCMKTWIQLITEFRKWNALTTTDRFIADNKEME